MSVPAGGQGGIWLIAAFADIHRIAIHIHRIQPGQRTGSGESEADFASDCQHALAFCQPGGFIDDPAEGIVADLKRVDRSVGERQFGTFDVSTANRDRLAINLPDHVWATIAGAAKQIC